MDWNSPFREAIRNAPGEHTPRLVYADWLAEHGDKTRDN